MAGFQFYPLTLLSRVERLLNTSGVRYIHIRNTEAGCYIARIERNSGNEDNER